MTNFFKHSVGDGIHYINENKDTSDVCILFNVEVALSRNLMPDTLESIWNRVYPDDLMSLEDVAYISFAAIDHTNPFNIASPEDLHDLVEDVRAMGCPALADELAEEFSKIGLVVY